MENSQLIIIVAVAMIAGIILFRLFSVLGRRTGNEREPPQPYQRIGGGTADDKKVVPIPTPAVGASVAGRPSDPAAQALLDIKLADKSFETDHFLGGARHAYEMILTAFAAGDRQTLRPLLSEEVFSAFDGVIKGRDERKERTTFTFVGVKDAKITHAALKGRTAEVTVAFHAQYISATSNETGAVLDGDPKTVRDADDVWTFARDVKATDPNWTLVATGHGAQA